MPSCIGEPRSRTSGHGLRRRELATRTVSRGWAMGRDGEMEMRGIETADVDNDEEGGRAWSVQCEGDESGYKHITRRIYAKRKQIYPKPKESEPKQREGETGRERRTHLTRLSWMMVRHARRSLRKWAGVNVSWKSVRPEGSASAAYTSSRRDDTDS